MKYNLQIQPAASIELRHQIAELIEQHGYNVWSQGQFTDGSCCDINFDTPDEAVKQMTGVEVKEGEDNEISSKE